jgi:hypothetical protein
VGEVSKIMDIMNLPGTALISFGAVWIISYIAEKYFDRQFPTEQKLIMGGLVAFGWGYVPADLGLEFINRVKDAIAVTVGITGFYQGGKGIVRA